MALISQSEVENRIGRDLTTSEAAEFETRINAIQSYIENRIGTGVEQVSETDRKYDGGVKNLTIDACTDVTALKQLDYTNAVIHTYDTDDYVVEPINGTLKEWIVKRGGKFPAGKANIQVTAKFSIYGDTNTLNIVKNVIIDMYAWSINNADRIKSEQIEGYSVAYAEMSNAASIQALDAIFPEL